VRNLFIINPKTTLIMTPIDYNNPNEMWRHNGYDPYKGLSDKERMMAGCLQLFIMVGAFIVALLICALFGSCTTTKYVPVPEYHTDTLRIVQHQRDSIYLSDSIYVNDFVRGDTVYKTTERWHTQWRERIVHDTIYKSKTDSIPYPVEVVKEVPAKLTWWQQTRLHLANILLYLILIVGIIYVGKKHIKRLRGE
jgi:hypothetical protein